MKKEKPEKSLCVALKADLSEIKAMKGDDEKLSRWLDKFDPNGECGVEFFKKYLENVTGVSFGKYIPVK